MRRLFFAFLALFAVFMAVPLIAQEDVEAQKSGFLKFVEDKLSTPDRQITINGLEGALSSDVKIAQITLSDAEGVWMRITNASLNWNQAALLTGQLIINALSAEKVDFIRPALVSEGVDLPSPEANGLIIPQLPVIVRMENLSLPSVVFGEDMFGLGSEIALEGRLVLEAGSLDTALKIDRLDGPGGVLKLVADYQKEKNTIALDLSLEEPADGVLVNLLDVVGRPPLSFKLAGSGPVDALETKLSLDAGEKRVLTGSVQLARQGTGVAATADLYGPIATLAPSVYQSFFGDETALKAKAFIYDGGGLELSDLTFSGGELFVKAAAKTEKDGFLSQLNVHARIVGQDGRAVLLPGGGGTLAVSQADAKIAFGDGDNWSGRIDITDLDFGAAQVGAFTLAADGVAQNLQEPTSRRITFNGDGEATDITSDDEQLVDALGQSVGLGFAGLWQAGGPLQIAQARLLGKALEVSVKGNVASGVFDGDMALKTNSIAPFSGLVDRQLSGQVDMLAKGQVTLLSGAFDLSLAGWAQDLKFGFGTADQIFAGRTQLGGRIARSGLGITADRLSLETAEAKVAADGLISSRDADFKFDVALNDLALVSDKASGAFTLAAKLKGTDGVFKTDIVARVPNGRLVARRLSEASLSLEGQLADGAFKGQLRGDGFLDGYKLALQSDVAHIDGQNSVENLLLEAGGTRIKGAVTQNVSGLLAGAVDLYSPDIGMLAAFALTEAKGVVEAKIRFAPSSEGQSIALEGRVDNVLFADAQMGQAQINAQIENAFGVPIVAGRLQGKDLVLAGVDIASLDAEANAAGKKTDFNVQSVLDNGAQLALLGQVNPLADGVEIALQSASLRQSDQLARLVQPSVVAFDGDGKIRLDDLAFEVGSGRVALSGNAGPAVDLDIAVQSVPLSFANIVRPDLGLSGTLNGSIQVSGTQKKPNVRFDIAGRGIGASALAGFDITPLSVDASGQFAGGTLSLAAAQADSPSGLSMNAVGNMPLVGSGGDLQVKGQVPLNLANRFVAQRGGQVLGTAFVDARVSGSLAQIAYGGAITTQNTEIIDPLSNLRVQNIVANVSLSGDQAIIEKFTGDIATGGSVAVTGSLSLANPERLPADIQITLNSARYADGTLFVATASGSLTLTGDLMRNSLLAGDVRLERAEIAIPEFTANDDTLVAVKHVGPSNEVVQSLKRTQLPAAARAKGQAQSSVELDVTVTAPNQIFVRGRGVDAELGGAVRLTGSLNAIQPIGGFSLIRGRLNILGQRVDFDSGQVTLVGDLDPYLDFKARSKADDGVTVFVSVTGVASDLQITFSSDPELPQDEVLSLLIFKRALADLSPLQLVKLAGAAAELMGGGGNSLVDGLRGAIGLDDIDIVTDSEGNAAVKAGAYLQDNVYISVEAGAQGQGKVSIDLDLTDSVKARGSATNDGENSIGIFYEKDF